MKTFNIYFSDLNEDAQKRLMKEIGIEDPSEMNWDIDMCPLCIYDFEEVSDERIIHMALDSSGR